MAASPDAPPAGAVALAATERALVAALRGDDALRRRRALAKTITLLESTRAEHRARADELLGALLAHAGAGARSLRLGISGVPGAGKSTFIEALGLFLVERAHRVAVLAVDPSSSVSGGSILGDKTRMVRLAAHPQAFIRPSPSAGTLGGVAEKTREAMLACEAAGHDVVLVETVGVGQSETAVAAMTDMFVLLQLPNAGDDLQAIKKGVMELADLVVVNKADLDATAAARARAQITGALRLLGGRTRREGPPRDARGEGAPRDARGEGAPQGPRGDGAPEEARVWRPEVLLASALEGRGIAEFWDAVTRFRTLREASGALQARRHEQDEAWMWERIEAGLRQRFRQHPAVRAALPALAAQVRGGTLAASVAARRLLDLAA
ncbi:MAG TPA: methylmalonyl Co-A mutase-associated GTPase MeaB [Rubrivivax sp.]|nr:methylmalonyl Co-A mutase-associated GTPase MeaB [Rubrivivax sp.]